MSCVEEMLDIDANDAALVDSFVGPVLMCIISTQTSYMLLKSGR